MYFLGYFLLLYAITSGSGCCVTLVRCVGTVIRTVLYVVTAGYQSRHIAVERFRITTHVDIVVSTFFRCVVIETVIVARRQLLVRFLREERV